MSDDLTGRLRDALLQRELIAVPATVGAMAAEAARTIEAHRAVVDLCAEAVAAARREPTVPNRSRANAYLTCVEWLATIYLPEES